MTPSAANTNDANRPFILLDGGTGREIQQRGGPFRQPEWSALALYEDPDIVRAVHESFLNAGSTAITTNTYALVPYHIGSDRFRKDAPRLFSLAISLAAEAKGDRQHVQILGSIPPVCGSYEPQSFDEATAKSILDWFMPVLGDSPLVDAYLLETVGSTREARFYLQYMQSFVKAVAESLDSLSNGTLAREKPVWLSFCIASHHGATQTPHLLTGETLTQAVHALIEEGLLTAATVPVVLVNCCDVKLVLNAVQELHAVLSPLGIRVGAYPNAFSIPPPNAANHTLRQVDYNVTPGRWAATAKSWINAGASVVGGCCGVGPKYIAALASVVAQSMESTDVDIFETLD
jgi:S-methylmethionine-dependent homocysteine/selenocysteine methylase